MPKSPMSAPQRSVFARRLEGMMLDRGWNAAELARRATAKLPHGAQRSGVSRQDVSKYLSGKIAPSPVTLDVLASALDVSPQDLLPSAAMPVSRSPEQVAAGVAEAVNIRQIGPDSAWVSVNQAVSWPVALEIMRLLKGNK